MSLPEWLSLEKPTELSTSRARSPTIGMSMIEAVYAAAAKSPRNRCSPVTSPAASKVLIPT